jgi:hypothetical protein
MCFISPSPENATAKPKPRKRAQISTENAARNCYFSYFFVGMGRQRSSRVVENETGLALAELLNAGVKMNKLVLSTLVSTILVASYVTSAMAVADKEEIRKVFKANIDKVRECYEDYMNATKTALSGKIVVEWHINSAAEVEKATMIEESSEKNLKEVAECVIKSSKSWKFPKADIGEVHVVRYPFILSPNLNQTTH